MIRPTRTEQILERLVAFKSISADSNLELIGYVEALLSENGFEVHRIADATGEKAGLFARFGPPVPGVLLSGHTDVVPTEGQAWTHDPFILTRDGDHLYGRGTTDMKGFIASALALAERAADVPLQRPLLLAFSYEEEIGCLGIRQMIDAMEDRIGRPEFCIVGEPTQMQVAIGHKGKGALRAICRGQSGHSALAPNFANAIHIAIDFVQELRALQTWFADSGSKDPAYEIPYTTLHVGKISGGRVLNIVAEEATVEFEYRHVAADAPEDIMEQILKVAETVASRYREKFAGASISVERYNAYPGLDVAEQSDIVTMVQNLARTNSVCKVSFGTESGFFDGLAIPTVVCGPGSMTGQGHMPDEYITTSQLAACDAMMDRLLEYLGSERPDA